jgi:hypothetical protein
MSDVGKRIIGEDGKLTKGSLGATVVATTGDAIPIAANKFVKIITKASTGSIFGNLPVGAFYISPIEMDGHYVGANDLDSSMYDLTGWSLEISSDEIETTVLLDNFKKYRKGKKDANGSASFVYIKGTTDASDGLLNQFFQIAEISATGVVTFNDINTDPVYIIGYVDSPSTAGYIREVTIMQVEFFNFALPMNMGEAMNIETPFRLVGDSDPIFYKITNA